LLGALAFLAIALDDSQNIYAQVGLVTLIGLAPRNAPDWEVAEQTFKAGIRQPRLLRVLRLNPAFAPILWMTAIAALASFFQLVRGHSAGRPGRQQKSLGHGDLGGTLLVAHRLSLVSVPPFYVRSRRLEERLFSAQAAARSRADQVNHCGAGPLPVRLRISASCRRR